MKKKLVTLVVHHLDGTKTDTIVWGGDDAASGADAKGHKEQQVVATFTTTYPGGVKVDSIIWGS